VGNVGQALFEAREALNISGNISDRKDVLYAMAQTILSQIFLVQKQNDEALKASAAAYEAFNRLKTVPRFSIEIMLARAKVLHDVGNDVEAFKVIDRAKQFLKEVSDDLSETHRKTFDEVKIKLEVDRFWDLLRSATLG